MIPDTVHRSILAVLALLGGLPGGAASAAETYRFSGALGLAGWSELGDVRPYLGGDFDDTGLGFELSFHGRVGEWGPVAFLAGVVGGGLSFDSNVTGTEEGEDLLASVFYLAPSLQAEFARGERHRLFLDAGFGWYSAAVDEWEDSCFWSCDVYEYYDDSAAGGYLGLGADFDVGEPGDIRITTSIRAHFVDFDAVTELDPADGSLDGPIYEWLVGVAFGL